MSHEALSRAEALRLLMDFAVRAADEAMCVGSERDLRDAAARIADAWSKEERFMLGKEREPA